MSDGQIVSVVLSAAATDISQAELALARSSHPEVRTLARELVADNTLLDQNTLHLLASLGIQPTESAESDRLVETSPFVAFGSVMHGCLTRVSAGTPVNVAGGGSVVPTFVVEPR